MQIQKLFSKESRLDLFLLLLIVVTGTVLRFWNFNQSPFTHDEIGTLQQINYSSISEVIEKEVKNDVHPSGLFVFVHYWTKFFGRSEQSAKFPLIIFGILSVILVYLIAAQWFSRASGLFAASLVSVMQYTIMYSNIARPYSSGIFFSLLMVWCMINFFDEKTRRKLLWLIGFVIAASCCTYNHYFSLFFAGLVSATGFLFVTRKNILSYCLALLSIALLHLPHLSIFISQISKNKGVGGPDGWLGKPDSGYLFTYIFYMFHYSKIFLLLSLTIASSGMLLKKNRINSNLWRYRIICLLWFLIPFAAGYLYSVKVNPVLQYSGLIFSFPFVLMLLFSFVTDIKPFLKISFVVFILVTGITTLVYGRKYYELFYNQGINKITQEINSAGQKFGKDSVDAIVDVEDYFLTYYKTKYSSFSDAKFISLNHGSTISDFQNMISNSRKNYFVFASVKIYPLECVQILKKYFPYVVSEYKGHLTEIYFFSKLPITTAADDEIIFASENNFSVKPSGWNYDEKKVFSDSTSDERYFSYETSDEYGVEFQLPLDGLIKSRTNIINISVDALLEDTASSPLLVMTMESDGKSLDWRATKFSDYLKPNEAGNVFLSVRFSDIHIITKNVKLKIYVWNKDHADFRVSNLEVSSEKGNPYFYGLFEEF